VAEVDEAIAEAKVSDAPAVVAPKAENSNIVLQAWSLILQLKQMCRL
jgi:hypothetical protein